MCECPSEGGPGWEVAAEAGALKSLHSPDFPLNYCDNLRCAWLITPPPGHVVRCGPIVTRECSVPVNE